MDIGQLRRVTILTILECIQWAYEKPHGKLSTHLACYCRPSTKPTLFRVATNRFIDTCRWMWVMYLFARSSPKQWASMQRRRCAPAQITIGVAASRDYSIRTQMRLATSRWTSHCTQTSTHLYNAFSQAQKWINTCSGSGEVQILHVLSQFALPDCWSVY